MRKDPQCRCVNGGHGRRPFQVNMGTELVQPPAPALVNHQPSSHHPRRKEDYLVARFEVRDLLSHAPDYAGSL
jgi:hypothetical protein